MNRAVTLLTNLVFFTIFNTTFYYLLFHSDYSNGVIIYALIYFTSVSSFYWPIGMVSIMGGCTYSISTNDENQKYCMVYNVSTVMDGMHTVWSSLLLDLSLVTPI